MESYPIYNAITKHWPKIATAIVVGIGLLELALNSMNADSTMEWYFLAWGGLTGGIWFIFDLAEKATSNEASKQLTHWIRKTDMRSQFEALPDRFAALFDLIFGKDHFTFFCFRRSVVVSIISSWFTSTIVYSFNPDILTLTFGGDTSMSLGETAGMLGFFGVIALGTNLIPDYLSLLQTRFMMNLARAKNQVLVVLLLDLIITALIFVIYVATLAGILTLIVLSFDFDEFTYTNLDNWIFYSLTYEIVLAETLAAFTLSSSAPPLNLIVLITFITTFFTSIWLWLYMMSAFISRVLLRLNKQVGFLIRIVDVETQPFRSLGFVSVVLVSVFFLPGLAFVVW